MQQYHDLVEANQITMVAKTKDRGGRSIYYSRNGSSTKTKVLAGELYWSIGIAIWEIDWSIYHHMKNQEGKEA